MTTEWRPDTCECILRYDELLPNGDPKWLDGGSILCAIHPTPQAALNSNRNKNQLLSKIVETLSVSAEELIWSHDKEPGTYRFEFADPAKNTPEMKDKIRAILAQRRDAK